MSFFSFTVTATTEIYTLSLHDALPISVRARSSTAASNAMESRLNSSCTPASRTASTKKNRSEEHTSELQSHSDLVCRLLLEKKKYRKKRTRNDRRRE